MEPTKPKKTKAAWETVEAEIAAAEPKAITNRGITSATVKKYGVAVYGEKHIYPYHKNGDSLATSAKTRLPVGEGRKIMPTSGAWASAGLFGQQLFSKGGRFLTITEGETDAMASYQMHNGKGAHVSVKNGADGALQNCKDEFKYIDSFDTIVLAFDNDAPGQKAAQAIARLFAGKCKIVKMDEGADPVDYLRSNRGAEFVDQWWKAELVTPDGIISAASSWDLVSEPIQAPDWFYPWKDVNEITYGGRFAELVMVTAGSGLGKSQFVREMFHHILKSTDHKVGGMFMEETPKKTLLSLMSMAVNKLLHLPKILWNDDGTYDSIEPRATQEELHEAFEAEFGNERVYLYDHFGSNNVDTIVAQIKYMVKGLGCKVIFLDHISIVISGGDNGDERKAIDHLMTKLRECAQETECAIIAVSHLTRPAGKGHEEGAATSLSQLRGSGAIGQLSDITIGLERNGQAECELERNTTRVRVLKNRFAGETGLAANLLWSRDTGRMTIRQIELEEAL
jgi:twinkle protein